MIRSINHQIYNNMSSKKIALFPPNYSPKQFTPATKAQAFSQESNIFSKFKNLLDCELSNSLITSKKSLAALLAHRLDKLSNQQLDQLRIFQCNQTNNKKEFNIVKSKKLIIGQIPKQSTNALSQVQDKIRISLRTKSMGSQKNGLIKLDIIKDQLQRNVSHTCIQVAKISKESYQDNQKIIRKTLSKIRFKKLPPFQHYQQIKANKIKSSAYNEFNPLLSIKLLHSNQQQSCNKKNSFSNYKQSEEKHTIWLKTRYLNGQNSIYQNNDICPWEDIS